MRYLVLGDQGMLGSELVRFLRDKKEEVLTYNGDLVSGRIGLEFIINQSDFIYFLASNVGGADFMNSYEKSYPFLFNNVSLMNNVFYYINNRKKPFLYASNHIVNDPDSIHANVKKIGERFTESLGGLSVRFWNLYGYQKNPEKYNAISSFIKQGLDKKNIFCKTDGKEKRQFLYTKDASEALYLISLLYDNIKKTHKKNYIDVTSFQWNTIEEALENIATEINCSWSTSDLKSKPRKHYEPDKILLNHWQPKYTLSNGLKELIGRYKNGC